MLQDLMFLLADEAEAVKGYLKVLEKVTDEETKAVLQEIVDDEYNHIGRLTALVSDLDASAGEHIANGIEGKE
jgi:rubrerythrin